jgi:uncharacterized membrane protein
MKDLKKSLKKAVQDMTMNQKIAVVAVAVLIPIGAWLGLGFPTDKAALGILGASLVSNIVSSIQILFGTTPASE